MSADLQYDLHDANAKAEAPVQPDKADDPRQTREIVKRIEVECGLSTIQQIVEKAERHQDTFLSLTEMRKNLQVKVIKLLQKRDSLKQ